MSCERTQQDGRLEGVLVITVHTSLNTAQARCEPLSVFRTYGVADEVVRRSSIPNGEEGIVCEGLHLLLSTKAKRAVLCSPRISDLQSGGREGQTRG